MIHGNLSTAGQEKDLKVGRITVLGRGGILCHLTVWYMAPSPQGQEGAILPGLHTRFPHPLGRALLMTILCQPSRDTSQVHTNPSTWPGGRWGWLLGPWYQPLTSFQITTHLSSLG